MSDLKENGFPSKITRMQLVQLLNLQYPNHDWKKAYLLRGRYAQQRRLERMVRFLFEVCGSQDKLSPLSHKRSYCRVRRYLQMFARRADS